MKISKVVFIFILAQASLSGQDTLNLLFVGDVMGHSPQIKSAATGKGNYDYDPCFKFVKPLIERADLAVANLELTLPGKAPYTGYPMFRSPDALADALKNAGFDLVVTANNHSNDAHGLGVKNTIKKLRELELQQTGTFRDQADRDVLYPLILWKNGFKIAFLNYTYGTNGVPTEAPTIVNLIDDEQMKEDLARARSKKPDFIIAVMHWGLEYQLKENEEQRRIAHLLIKNGADLIIGMHPHVVQPIKRETATDAEGKRREVLVAYSLGNFISNQTKPHTDGGIMFSVNLVKKKGSKRAELGDYAFIPIWRYIHKNASGKSTFYALPIAHLERNPKLFAEMSASARAKMKTYAEGVRKRLACPERKW